MQDMKQPVSDSNTGHSLEAVYFLMKLSSSFPVAPFHPDLKKGEGEGEREEGGREGKGREGGEGREGGRGREGEGEREEGGEGGGGGKGREEGGGGASPRRPPCPRAPADACCGR